MSASGFADVFNPILPSSCLEQRPSSSATSHLESASDQQSASRNLQQPILLRDLSTATYPSRDSSDEDDLPNERARLVDPEEFDSEEEDDGPQNTHMNRKTHTRREPDGSAPLTLNGDDQEVGHQNGDMALPLEHRRKHTAAADTSLSSPAGSLLGRDSLDFQEEDISKEREDASGAGFFDLPLQDRRNFLLLVLLYFLQGIPMGLAGGSVPFLLKSAKYGVSYGQIGIFSLASYPYSLKLLWSPIVDAVWSRRIGRRKSWILPVQVFSGLGMLWLGANAEAMMTSAGANGGAGIWGFTGWWFFLVFTCATQDIAVDGESAFPALHD